MKKIFLLLFYLVIFNFAKSSALYAQACFVVEYGAGGVEGRVYKDGVTTFTYTISGTNSSSCQSGKAILKDVFLDMPNCSPVIQFATASPYDSISPRRLTWPSGWNSQWKRPSPDIYMNYSDPAALDPIFGKYGIHWFGYHGSYDVPPPAGFDNVSPPPVVSTAETVIFTVKLQGDVSEGSSYLSYRQYSNTTGWYKPNLQVPGPACGATCPSQMTLDFSSLSAGSFPIEYQGIQISASTSTGVGLAGGLVVNSTSPGLYTNLGSPNTIFSGSGQPAYNYSTGAGLGNFLNLGNVLAIPSSSSPSSNSPGAGMLAMTFAQPVKICGAKFLSVSSTGASITAYRANNTQVFSVPIANKGVNSLQSVNVCAQNSYEVSTLIMTFSGSSAVDDLLVCPPTTVNTATPTPTRTVTSTPTVTQTPTRTSTPLVTATPTKTVTLTPTRTVTSTPTVTQTSTRTSTPLVTSTPTRTSTVTKTYTPTMTQTQTSTIANTNTPTNTAVFTPTNTFTATPTVIFTPTSTPAIDNTPTPIISNTPTLPVTGGTPTPVDSNCKPVNNNERRALLDHAAKLQEKTIINALSQVKSIADKAIKDRKVSKGKISSLKKLVADINVLLKRVHQQQVDNWVLSWIGPKVDDECPQSASCKNFDYGNIKTTYLNNANAMKNAITEALGMRNSLRKILGNEVLGKVKKDASFVKKADTTYANALEQLKKVPASSRWCD
jgi:hypothetical protein